MSQIQRHDNSVPRIRPKNLIPFIIVGMPRTGSTLLLSSLQQHPNIRSYEELFHFDERERSVRHSVARPDARFYFDAERGDAIEFLRRYVFATHPKMFKAIGFKVFGEFVKGPGTRNLFQRLREEIDGLRVLHVIRPNYLDVLVSRALAALSGQWENRVGATKTAVAGALQHDDIRLTLDIEMVATFFDRMAQADKYCEDVFSSGTYYQIGYSALSTDLDQSMTKVFAFLDQTDIKVRNVLNKQVTSSLRSVIDNFDETKAAFADTKFSGFFEGTSSIARVDDRKRQKVLTVPNIVVPNLTIWG